MKNWPGRLCLVSAFALLVLVNRPMITRGAEEQAGSTADRLERVERRVNELAQRQEQFMQHFSAAQQQQQQRPMPGPGGEGMGRPMAGPGQEGMAPRMPGGGPPAGDGRILHKVGDMLRLMFVVGVICNILLAVWIFGDIRKRGDGSGLFVVLALFAGIPAAIIYSLVRLGDRKI
jgi:hypothetical protein